MKQNTFFVNVWTLMLILGLIACGEKKTQVKTELQRIEAFAFDVIIYKAMPVLFAILLQPGSMVKSV